MTASYTFDVFSSLDGYGAASAKLERPLGKQGPELLTTAMPWQWRGAADCLRGQHVSAFARMLASRTQESEVPLRSHGSLSLNRALMAAGLVDRLQVDAFSVPLPARPGLTRSSRVPATSTWS